MAAVPLVTLVGGLALLAVSVAAWGFTGWRIADRVVPSASGSLAGLTRATFAVVVAIVEAELLGSVALLREWAVVAVAVLGALAVHQFLPLAADRDRGQRPPLHRVDAVLAVLGVGFALSRWMELMVPVSIYGLGHPDSLQYHAPMALDFVQRASTLHYLFVGPHVITTFHPMSNELLSALLILPIGRDWWTPVLPLVFVALALLAAWVFGRVTGRPGAAGLAVCAIAVVIETPILIEIGAGDALNDYASLAAVAVAATLLVALPPTRGAAFAIGIAAGLGIGLKSSVVVACGLIGLCVVLGGSDRVRRLVFSVLGMTVAGGYWYVRNLLLTGNPVPGVGGGILPSPDLGVTGDQAFSVAHYFADRDVVTGFYLPQLDKFMGDAWIPVLVVGLVGAVLALIEREPLRRTVGVLALVAFAAYLVTPTGAFGPPGKPEYFGQNVRYAMPGLMLGLLLFATSKVPWSRALDHRVVVLGLLALLDVRATTVLSDALKPHLSSAWLVLGAFVVTALAFVARGASDARLRRVVGWGLVAAVGLSGAVVAKVYADRASIRTAAAYTYLAAWEQAMTDLDLERVGLIGVHTRYGVQDVELQRRLVTLGRPTPHGGFAPLTSCEQTLDAVARARVPAVMVERVKFVNKHTIDWLIATGFKPLVYDQKKKIGIFDVPDTADVARCPE